jgi:hypothetical protein
VACGSRRAVKRYAQFSVRPRITICSDLLQLGTWKSTSYVEGKCHCSCHPAASNFVGGVKAQSIIIISNYSFPTPFPPFPSRRPSSLCSSPSPHQNPAPARWLRSGCCGFVLGPRVSSPLCPSVVAVRGSIHLPSRCSLER